MNFKNIFMFAFTRKFDWDQETLNKHLGDFAFTPCASTELSHFGFVPALGKGSSALAHEAIGNILICARKEEKILPAQTVKDLTEKAIALFLGINDRRATKKERETIKEDVIFELLPRAFSRFTDTHMYINASLNLIVINASSRGKAEDIMSLLRKALGTLPVTSFSPDTAPDEVMTGWLASKFDVSKPELGFSFVLGESAEFNAIGDDGAKATVKNQDLKGDEVKAHLDAGKYVTKIGLEWDESISFVLCDDLSIKRIKFEDVITEQNDDIDKDDHLARLDADFTLMAGETNRMIVDLLGEFGLKTNDYLEQ